MIPYGKSRSKVIYEGKLYSRQSTNIDMSKFRYLIITYTMYNYSDTNTAGSSNVILLDLTQKASSLTKYQASKKHPYNIFDSSYANFSDTMDIAVEVNAEKTNLKVVFGYNGSIQLSNQTTYYISKVVGVL